MIILRGWPLLLLAFALAARAAAECRDDLDESAGYTIRSVRVEGRWVPALTLPIAPGDRFSNAGVQAAMRAVQTALHSDDRDAFELQNLGALGVLHITRCLLVEGRQVDVLIEVRSLRVDLFEIGGNVLPIPRAPFATFYQAVPKPLLVLNPRFGLYQDKEYGFAPTAAINANLLDLSPTLRSENTRLDLAASGRKSVEESFYNADVSLAFSRLRPGELVEKLNLTTAFAGADEPRGDQTLRRKAGEIGGSVRLRPNLGLIQSLAFDAHYRYASNDLRSGAIREDTTEHALALRLLTEGRAGGGFLRAALWGDAASPDRMSDYGRVAGVVAFAKEILLAPNQTLGIEAILGGGKAWSAPAYARFYGGNSDGNFLYDAPDARALTAFPTGPLIRSLGEGQSRPGDAGSSAYWHLNLNIALPIPSLSRPLIPDEEVLPGITLKRLLKNKAGDSVSFYAVQLESEGMTPDAALAKARKTYAEVQPAIDFIADRANVYALKPLLLADIAGQEGQSVQAAVGGGLQLTIVTARMELGYMQTVSGGNNGSGNLFARIVFENIF